MATNLTSGKSWLSPQIRYHEIPDCEELQTQKENIFDLCQGIRRVSIPDYQRDQFAKLGDTFEWSYAYDDDENEDVDAQNLEITYNIIDDTYSVSIKFPDSFGIIEIVLNEDSATYSHYEDNPIPSEQTVDDALYILSQIVCAFFEDAVGVCL